MVLANPLSDDVRDGSGGDDSRAIEVRRELDHHWPQAARDANCQDRRALTIRVDDVVHVARNREIDNRIVAINDGSRRLSAGYPRKPKCKSRDSRNSD